MHQALKNWQCVFPALNTNDILTCSQSLQLAFILSSFAEGG